MTAMQELKYKLLTEVQNLKEVSRTNELIQGYREALKYIANDIDAQMLEKEKRQIIDARISVTGLNHASPTDDNSLQEAEDYYNKINQK